jgi:hypothetical protein
VRRDVALAVEVFEGIVERSQRNHRHIADHGGLSGIARGHEEAPHVPAPAVQRHRQHTAHGLDPSVERELPHGYRVLDEPRLDDSGGREHPSAMGRSKAVPTFRTSAVARLTMIRSTGNSSPAFPIAARTRSRLSRTWRRAAPLW